VRTYLWIAIGSAFGGVARVWLSGFTQRHLGDSFPWGILLVNVLGSFAMVLFAEVTLEAARFATHNDARQFFMAGVCGAFTTFSAFSFETLAQLRAGDWQKASAYVVVSVLLCLAGAWLGLAAARQINA